MRDYVPAMALAAQMALTAASLMPGVAQPAKGAMLLASFWCWGVCLGSLLYEKRCGGDPVAG